MKVPWSHPDIGEAEREAVDRVIQSGWVTMGKETEKFESELSAYLGCRHVVVTNTGTAALFDALIVKGNENLALPSYNYPVIQTISDICKYRVWYDDINPKTCLMIPPTELISKTTLVPVSFSGLPLNEADWEEFTDVMVEDSAEAFGAMSNNLKTGNQGWMSIFSFHVAKLITTIEGGAIATNSDEERDLLKQVRSRKNLNHQPTDVSSAIGRVQLTKADKYLRNRHRISEFYKESLNGLVKFQETPENASIHGNMMFPVFTKNSLNVSLKLDTMGVNTRIGWTPLKNTKASIQVSSTILCLPIYNTMRVEEAEYVVECLKKCL